MSGYTEFKNTISIKIDRSSLPKDGQKVWFQDMDTESWHYGYFSDGDDLFFINAGHWYNSWSVHCWCDEKDAHRINVSPTVTT